MIIKKTFKILFILFILLTNINSVFSFDENIDITSKHAILYNLNDDSIIYEKEADEKTEIASLTKIMTAIIAIENIKDLNMKTKIPSGSFTGLAAQNASLAGFRLNEVVTYEDLLYGVMLPSGADATKALAIILSGSENNFVLLMNKKANELSMTNTVFKNSSGLDHEGQYSSVKDVATLLKYALKNVTFKKIFTSNTYTTSNNRLKFTNTFYKYKTNYSIKLDYIIGAKTGDEVKAGLCLASIATYNNVDYLLVTTKSFYKGVRKPYNLTDAKTIYEYFFNNYGYQKVIKKNDPLISIKTKYSNIKEVTLKSTKDITIYLPNAYKIEDINLDYKYEGKELLDLNTKKDSKVGTYKVYYNDKLIDDITLYLKEDIPFSLIEYLMINYYLLIIICLILITTVIIIVMKIRKTKSLLLP